MSHVIKEKAWSEEELRQSGFERYQRKKQIVMARRLPAGEAPLYIKTEQGDTLIAEAGYMICYDAEAELQSSIADYHHWPVDPDIFAQTYALWPVSGWSPNPVQRHLMQHGCKPYFKSAGVWAKSLTEDAYIQSREHEKPVLVKQGRVMAIGAEGEPYHMGDKTFHERYEEAPAFRRLLNKLINFIKKV